MSDPPDAPPDRAAVIVFLIWVYTSAVVLLYGAEFTAAYSRLRRETAHTSGGSPLACRP
ncbi:MAG: hypothetical protein IMZ55_09795 [Acidobacteria bacterium]|nr:hypothetical protein [Acidobacteriota bacterium]